MTDPLAYPQGAMRVLDRGLISIRLAVPSLPHALVRRQSLLDRLGQGLTRVLTLVSAAARYGKTTLLIDWAATCAAKGIVVAWLSLDERDNDERRFWLYVVTAVSHIPAGNHGAPLCELAIAQARTEGWAAGPRLAGLHVAGSGSRDAAALAALVGDVRGTKRHIMDYLAEQVLRRQELDVQRFLMQTSILERLSGPLCGAVTGQPSAQAMLRCLERADLFVVPLDGRCLWYRYHHFADFLRDRLEQDEPGSAAELHRRAARWFERQAESGQTEALAQALKHWLKAGDEGEAARLAAEHCLAMLERGESRLVLR